MLEINLQRLACGLVLEQRMGNWWLWGVCGTA
jgi:hypothetical protein